MSNSVAKTIYPVDYVEKMPARFKPAAVFSDHAVFQRNQPVRIFGECPTGSFVTATLLHKNKWAAAGECFSKPSEKVMSPLNEEFLITLKPQEAGTDYSLTITCKFPDGHEETKTFSDIAFGEVWLAGGQSNMELELQNCKTGKDSLSNDKNVDVRFYYTQKVAFFGEDFYNHENNSGWSCFDSESAKSWSAVGYYFAKELSKKLGCIVGVIGCNWGGTSATAWTDEELLKKDAELSTYFDNYSADRSLDEQKADTEEYEAYAAAWQKRVDAFYAENPKGKWSEVLAACGECRYPGPRNSFLFNRPSGLYHTMLMRVAPYTIKGVIYYQGESDDHKPALYEKLLTTMIVNWRRIFRNADMPFLFVQLPVYRTNEDPDFKHWCIIRQCQQKVFDNIKNTGMAVTYELGAWNNIHPVDKTQVAHRLYLQAAHGVYGVISEEEACAPSFDYALVENYGKKDAKGVNLGINLGIGADWEQECCTIRIFLKNAGKALQKKLVLPENDNRPLEEIPEALFELSEDGENYYPAIWNLCKDTINLTCDEVSHPRYVRYAWSNYSRISIFGANGLPLAPFTAEI
ncbi:MAG: sialate O-acetylesterase [Lachnospiraceae bacterium]|nr:sialate O-acetylesterase [Lachnospiraceae bacterium]